MDGMKYEATKVNKKPSKQAVKSEIARELNQVATTSIVWHLVKRHKLAISVAVNICFIINYALPMWPNIVKSLI